jgi:hypothetical protein
MDGGGFDGRGARHSFCRSLGPIGQGSSKSRAPERFVRGITNLRADFHGSALFFASAQAIFGLRSFRSARSVNFQPSSLLLREHFSAAFAEEAGRPPPAKRVEYDFFTSFLHLLYASTA